MYEVELKVAVDAARTRSRLRERGAERLETVRQVDTYYDAPDRDFAETDEALRIRVERPLEDPDSSEDDHRSDAEESVRMTYKGPLIDADSKSREEHETGVDDGTEAAAILEGVGYTSAATVEKRRERYALEGYTLTLDRVRDVGEFIEIEREVAAESDVEPAREGAEAILETLELDPEEQIRTSYLGLLLASRNTEEGE